MGDLFRYELLDFGAGRKLERFGEVTVDRPDLAATNAAPVGTVHWAEARARFERASFECSGTIATARGKWVHRNELPKPWICAVGPARFELKLTDFGHV